MSFDWDHQFCLTCDRQTDGAVYCSESCRLADYEKTSAPSLGASSPVLGGAQEAPWTASHPRIRFYLPPPYDFSKPSPYGTTPQPQTFLSNQKLPTPASRRLTPSSSHSSLCSMQSSSSTSSEAPQLSLKATQELRAYASSFEQVRTQRRRLY